MGQAFVALEASPHLHGQKGLPRHPLARALGSVPVQERERKWEYPVKGNRGSFLLIPGGLGGLAWCCGWNRGAHMDFMGGHRNDG